jgi:riboflavin kinase/FMN adenylyltransferase
MKIYRHYEELPEHARGAVVAVGNFDGVHKGHQAVIGEAGRIAKASARPWAVLTFEPHPRLLFKPDQPPFRLTPFRIKVRQVEALGVDEVVVLHFDKEFAALSAEDFIEQVLVDGFAASHVVCGYDFVFGKGRKGDTEMLLHYGKRKGFGFTAVSQVNDADGQVYSSTRVRDCLKAADPEGAARVLGRPFEIEGRVEHGDARGRSIGFPTANLHLGEYMRPATGVYAVRAGVDEGAETRWVDGVANFGNRPTFDGGDVVLEVHLFDYAGDLYGRHLRVRLLHHLRAEQKFDGIDALKAQIAADCERAKSLLARGAA